MRRTAAFAAVCGATMALATAGVAAAHGVGTPHRHAEEDSVTLSQGAQRRLNHHTRVTAGIAADDCAQLLTRFFAARRQRATE